jgi:adenylate kinase
MGMQGAGKGTQADILREQLRIPHVTSGGMFRTVRQQDTPLGRQIKALLDSGSLVPDDLTIPMVAERLAQPDIQERGVILDGFPRTVAQARALDDALAKTGKHISIVPYFVISEEEAIRRLGGRRVCTVNDNHIYHVVDNPPRVPDVCDHDGAPLKIRNDDQPDAIRQRISAYLSETTPVLDYYRAKGLLHEVNAEQPIDKVTADLLAEVDEAQQ